MTPEEGDVASETPDDGLRPVSKDEPRATVRTSTDPDEERRPPFVREVAATSLDDAVAHLLGSMNNGQYFLLVEAVRQLGGEMRLDPRILEESRDRPTPGMEVDVSDGPIVLKLLG